MRSKLREKSLSGTGAQGHTEANGSSRRYLAPEPLTPLYNRSSLSIDTLLAHSGILAARAYLERTDEVTLARQVELSRLPAPTGAEARRGARVAELFREIGLRNVLIDEVGNVHGWLGEKGMGNGERAVVLCAHLDTVFGPDVDVAVRRQGGNGEGGGGGRLEGQGISENPRGLAALA